MWFINLPCTCLKLWTLKTEFGAILPKNHMKLDIEIQISAQGTFSYLLHTNQCFWLTAWLERMRVNFVLQHPVNACLPEQSREVSTEWRMDGILKNSPQQSLLKTRQRQIVSYKTEKRREQSNVKREINVTNKTHLVKQGGFSEGK